MQLAKRWEPQVGSDGCHLKDARESARSRFDREFGQRRRSQKVFKSFKIAEGGIARSCGTENRIAAPAPITLQPLGLPISTPPTRVFSACASFSK